jgi:large subunit ribosomal protein L13
MKTYTLKAKEVEERWHVLDAEERPLGRLASEAAQLLRGKHRPTFTPHMDNGDFVIVVNASKVKVTGSKTQQKVYYRHTGYPGGLRETVLSRMLETRPERVIQAAVKGMLPHNRLGRKLLGHLKVYAGPEHPHEAQVNARRRRKAAAEATAPAAIAEEPATEVEEMPAEETAPAVEETPIAEAVQAPAEAAVEGEAGDSADEEPA